MRVCTFFGHKSCPKSIKERLFLEIENLIVNENVDTFYVGTQGEFDRFAYEVLCDIEKKYKIKTIVVLAYLDKNKQYVYYDIKKTIFPDCLTKTPPRFAINHRNLFMLKNSDYLICFLDNPFSNTFTFVERAIKKKIKTINLGKFDIERI